MLKNQELLIFVDASRPLSICTSLAFPHALCVHCVLLYTGRMSVPLSQARTLRSSKISCALQTPPQGNLPPQPNRVRHLSSKVRPHTAFLKISSTDLLTVKDLPFGSPENSYLRLDYLFLQAITSCRKLLIQHYTAFHWDVDSAMDSMVKVIMPRERARFLLFWILCAALIPTTTLLKTLPQQITSVLHLMETGDSTSFTLHIILRTELPGQQSYFYVRELFRRMNFLQGDARDAALMTFSVALFCVLGAQMYGIYMHLYFAAGLRPIIQHL